MVAQGFFDLKCSAAKHKDREAKFLLFFPEVQAVCVECWKDTCMDEGMDMLEYFDLENGMLSELVGEFTKKLKDSEQRERELYARANHKGFAPKTVQEANVFLSGHQKAVEAALKFKEGKAKEAVERTLTALRGMQEAM